MPSSASCFSLPITRSTAGSDLLEASSAVTEPACKQNRRQLRSILWKKMGLQTNTGPQVIDMVNPLGRGSLPVSEGLNCRLVGGASAFEPTPAKSSVG